MYIPEDVIQSILEATNIRQLVGEFVALKKRGHNWVGLCPFHPDKNPSFSVSEDKQIFYCFGCGEGGNAFRFLMKMQGLSFLEAVKALAKRNGIPIPSPARSPASKKRLAERQRILELNELVAAFFHERLVNSKSALDARVYLGKRGISPETIERFRLGWAEERWDGLIGFLKGKGLSTVLAEKGGLIVARQGGNGHYDRFRGRIIFPITDKTGRIIAFGGRIIKQGGKEQPKYLNSPETLVYHKGRVLYGLSQNKSAIRQKGVGFVVEGYMDLLALVQAGIDNAVATLGTALTEEHVKLLHSICRKWVLVFDSDSAGQKAAFRALPMFYARNLTVKVLSLPEGHDPDSFIRAEGVPAWQKLEKVAPSGLDYVIERGRNKYGSDPDGRLKAVKDTLLLVEPVRDPIRKSLLISHISRKLGLREESLWEGLGPNKESYGNKVALKGLCVPYAQMDQKGRRANGVGFKNSGSAKLVGFLLSYPAYMEEFIDAGMDLWLDEPLLRNLWASMSHFYSLSGKLDLTGLLRQLETTPDLKKLAIRLSAEFPPCTDAEKEAARWKRLSEERKKKAIRQQLLAQYRQSDEEIDDLEFLRQIQRLR